MITADQVSENYPLSKADRINYALRTMSSRAFYSVVATVLRDRGILSVVRMGDGERQLFVESIRARALKEYDSVVGHFEPKWHERMGTAGITYRTLHDRMSQAIMKCGYFGPNVNGLDQAGYSVYPWYKLHGTNQGLVDNFFVNDWTLEQRTALLKSAKNVLVLHRNPVTANTFAKRARAYLDVGIRHIPLSNWDQAEKVVEQCAAWDYPLVLVSAGPATKWIIPEIAAQGPGRVVLDLGNAMDHWLLLELYKADPTKLDGAAK